MYFLQKWKEAKTIAILKKDKTNTSSSSYRPISLLSNLGKLYKILINNIINFFCTTNNIMPENQYGFRVKHSTIHSINKLVSDIHWALNGDKCLGACLIDLEKAFDTLWLDGLIFKLKMKKFSPILIKFI